MSERNLRKYCCCFTGHHPEKLGMPEREVKSFLEKAIDTAIANGFVSFISGMVRGVDMWAAEIVIKREKRTIIYT